MKKFTELELLEYSELKSEQRDRIKTRDTLYLSAFAFYGTIFSYGLNSKISFDVWVVLAFVGTMLGHIFLENEVKISGIRKFLKSSFKNELKWELWIDQEKNRVIRKKFQLLIDLSSFSLPSIFALWLSRDLEFLIMPRISWFIVLSLTSFIVWRTITRYTSDYAS